MDKKTIKTLCIVIHKLLQFFFYKKFEIPPKTQHDIK